ncbi:DUF309 domain-containing protein [Jeotgalibacillus proteolyticus]|uniref:DUF309 domain-containing protein n=1 Tax=Jeotgalibacillus proteolyticus TaxID=2082395 RepID=A0A2S5GEH3_9BACL|nr:DUF309 domain-containing protein [Jeotgalibacillus proteolyticus]PPA71304.1 DUF309 domain-containing protein [Jeotgalibacillus proteolyticus]
MNKYPQSYIDYLVHFHGDRDYFECHEALEEFWKEHTEMDRNSIWVAWIQLAVALYHQRRGNFSGAKRMIEKAFKKFRHHEKQLPEFGMQPALFLEQLQNLTASITAKTPYTSIQLPIDDFYLESTCREQCLKKGFTWGQISDLSDRMITERHRLRDRSDVILLREKELRKRNNKPRTF